MCDSEPEDAPLTVGRAIDHLLRLPPDAPLALRLEDGERPLRAIGPSDRDDGFVLSA